MKTTGSLSAALAFTLALTWAAGTVRAQVAGYPDRPIKLLVGFGAGTDIVARILAPKMSNSLGQSVVVLGQGIVAGDSGCPLSATSGLMHRSKDRVRGPSPRNRLVSSHVATGRHYHFRIGA